MQDTARAPSILTNQQKEARMKDAMIDMELPMIAMWGDESVALLNQGVYDLMYDDADRNSIEAYEVLSHFKVFTENFDRELEKHEYPLCRLIQSKTPFSKVRVGLIDSKQRRRILGITGHCVFDKETGEFQAGICAVTELTWYFDLIKSQIEQNEQQFQLICETLPQMVWILVSW